MEARFGGEGHRFYIAGTSNGLGKKSLEWDINKWKWDGDLFVATPSNAVPYDCRSKQLFPAPSIQGLSNGSRSGSEETDFGVSQKGKDEYEKRRRIVVEEADGTYNETGSLTLNLGGNTYPIMEEDLANWEGKDAKRSKLQGDSSNRSNCQVEGCGADLRGAKDYHRRHKVCEMHAKASRAMVGNVMQRFCQQCSRFHLLQEFDEGKRSCRRRLAGHNRRRRKTHPDANVSGSPMTSDQASSYLLISLLRILSNLLSEKPDQAKDQDLLAHILKNIASLSGSSDTRNLSALLQASQDMHRLGTAGTSSEAANPVLLNGVAAEESSRPLCSPSKMTYITGTQSPLSPTDNFVPAAVATVELPSERNVIKSTVKRVGIKDFDLNDSYDGAQDGIEGCGKSAIPGTLETRCPDCPSWMLQDSHHSSPPQTSGNSDSSARSLSNSNGDAQSRTDRIVFKLFGKDPNDFPLSLRGQILDWLSHSPTDMESYIRPGCIILTLYIRLAESEWEELCRDLSSSLNRLLNVPGDDFWRTGWLYARIQHRIAFMYNGQLVLDTPLLLKSHGHCSILSIKPIAVSISARVTFKVKYLNLARSTGRLLCSFEGRYLVPEAPQPLVEGADTSQHDGTQFCSFSCSLPNATGRGFIEVDDNGLSSGFFPFIVAEDDVCSEVRMLESVIEEAFCDDMSHRRSEAMHARNQAIDFLHEMGWLLRRSQARSRSQQTNLCPNVFPLNRFRWLMTFAMDREWCAVVKKLLDILFQGSIGLGEQLPVQLALSEDLLHRAVRKNCKSMVELLLRYTPDTTSKGTGPNSYLFKPDVLGPSNITPLHMAASRSGAEGVLDALTDDPEQLGIKAWNRVHDSTGFTPEDYARSRGFESYIDLVQKKISKKSDKGHLILDMPASLLDLGAGYKEPDGPNPGMLIGFHINKSKLRPLQPPSCKLCNQQLIHRSYGSRSLLYRPVMLSLVGIAAVCVCVGLLLKGPPRVLFAKSPFRWEMLDYGWI